MAKKDVGVRLWDNITDADFYNESNIEPVEMGEFERAQMITFFANVNYFRQIIRLSDSLKPVDRRYLYVMYKNGYTPGKKVKANVVTGKTMEYHAHTDSAIYGAIINSAQTWNTPVPLIEIKSNKGNISAPDEFAQPRYMDIAMSKYAYECFFADFDEDCVEVLMNSAKDDYEPMSLPAKFPNILVNGGFGLAPANTFRVPPFNVMDIIRNTTKVLLNPETTEVFMVPDLPTGCQIVDDGENIKSIVEYGQGNLRMRADIDIIEMPNAWCLKVRNVPWMVSLQGIHAELVKCTKEGRLPIKEVHDYSAPIRFPDGRVETVIDFRIMIDKAHDPKAIRSKLYKMTRLDVTLSVQFKAVVADLKVVQMTMKELIQSWINERRSYKRRLYNKKLTRITARIEFLDILIFLTTGENLEKTVRIIRGSNESEVVQALIKLGKMSSYQAVKIIDGGLRLFTKDAHARYVAERERLVIQREDVMEIIKSETRIDAIIAEELQDLKKYASPRKSTIVSLDGVTHISDSTHNLIITKQGYVKKLAYHADDARKNANMGAFRPSDYPINRLTLRNLESIQFFDSYGRYSTIPVHEIDNAETNDTGVKIFDIAKLNGSIVSVLPETTPEMFKTMQVNFGVPYLVTLTSGGYLKRTLLEEYVGIRTMKNAKAMKVRVDDHMVYAGIHFGNTRTLIYTKKGKFCTMEMKDLEPAGKDTMGLLSMRVEPDDECVGMAILGDMDNYVAMVTAKGLVKKVDMDSLGDTKKRLQTSSYLLTLDQNDSLIWVDGITANTSIYVCTRSEIFELHADEVVTHTRKAKAVKVIPLQLGNNIVKVETIRDPRHK